MAPATEPEEPVVEEYESDEFEVDDDEGDDEELQEDADDDEDEAEVEGNGQSLTSLLIVSDPNVEENDEDEDDGGYAPAGETDPADEPVDGYKRALTPEEGGDPAETDIPPAVPRVAAPANLKRKTSGDEGEDEDEDDGSEAKKAKV
ncbi:hypothetical protein DFH11DRAFT_1738328 [Phellopilus nigrolimitatus]|nr:hypothetical protein DFH11DRAFT_1738328 [Phellopilus nigrolimitatus]